MTNAQMHAMAAMLLGFHKDSHLLDETRHHNPDFQRFLDKLRHMAALTINAAAIAPEPLPDTRAGRIERAMQFQRRKDVTP